MTKPFSLAAVVFGAALLALSWTAAVQEGVPAAAGIGTVAGALTFAVIVRWRRR